MNKLPLLKPYDKVEIIAPASRCTDLQLRVLIELLESWNLNCLVAPNIFGKDLFCANTDALRFHHLKSALLNTETKAIFCARGGYGSMRLIEDLTAVETPYPPKIFVGMSDTTALQLFFQQRWQWPTIHGSAAPDRFSEDSIRALHALLFEEKEVAFHGLQALNQAAEEENYIRAELIGGNLCLVQASIGTIWQLDGRNKIILLEEVGERGYRVDRMLQHLQQASIFKEVKAVLLGDFSGGLEPDGSSLIDATLKRFATSCKFPVVQIKGIGHNPVNFPIPLGTMASLRLGKIGQLSCTR